MGGHGHILDGDGNEVGDHCLILVLGFVLRLLVAAKDTEQGGVILHSEGEDGDTLAKVSGGDRLNALLPEPCDSIVCRA